MVEKSDILSLDRLKQLQWHKIFNMFYIEPIVFILVFSHSLSGVISRNQIIYQACTTVFLYNETLCQELGTNNVSDYAKRVETEVQQYIADLHMTSTLLESIVPALCGIFVGAWSDHYGRKPLLLISMIGFSFTYIITAIICELSNYYALNPWYYVLAAVPHSILGGNCVFAVAAMCFISDVTDIKTRPYRMIFMEAIVFIGLMSGSLLSSYVYAATNATTTFIISGILICSATVFIAVCVPESLHLNKDIAANNVDCGGENPKSDLAKAECATVLVLTEEDVAKKSAVTTEKTDEAAANSQHNNDTHKAAEQPTAAETESTESDKRAGLLSLTHIREMFVTCFKERPFHDRSIILLITSATVLSIFVTDGAMTVSYLFVREKFHWSIRDFTFFATVNSIVPLIGALVGFLILRKLFGLSIVALALLAYFSRIIDYITCGLASESWHLYLATALGVFSSIGGPMCSTIISNIVPATDLGKIFSIKNILQSFAPFLAAPLYTYIYKASLATFPGLYCIVSAVVYTFAFAFLVIVLRFKYSHKEHYAEILK